MWIFKIINFDILNFNHCSHNPSQGSYVSCEEYIRWMRNKPLIPLTKDSSGRVGSGVYKDFDLTISIFNKSKPLTKMGGGGMGGNKIKVINSISWLKFSEMNKLKMFFMFIKIFYVRNISHVFLKTYRIMTVKTEKRVNKWNSKKRVK